MNIGFDKGPRSRQHDAWFNTLLSIQKSTFLGNGVLSALQLLRRRHVPHSSVCVTVVYYVVELKQSQINMPSASTNLPKAEEPGVLVVVYALLCLPQSTIVYRKRSDHRWRVYTRRSCACSRATARLMCCCSASSGSRGRGRL